MTEWGKAFWLLAGSSIALTAMPAAAQTASENAAAEAGGTEIIVTAQRRDQKITDTSVSVAAFSEERLEALGAQDVRDVALFAPSLNFVKSAQINQIAIRGLGSPGLEPQRDRPPARRHPRFEVASGMADAFTAGKEFEQPAFVL